MAEKPDMIEFPDFTELKKICQSYIEEVAKGDYVDEDFPHYIFETAITTLFGNDVWTFINQRKM
jgi:hypothetical protein